MGFPPSKHCHNTITVSAFWSHSDGAFLRGKSEVQEERQEACANLPERPGTGAVKHELGRQERPDHREVDQWTTCGRRRTRRLSYLTTTTYSFAIFIIFFTVLCTEARTARAVSAESRSAAELSGRVSTRHLLDKKALVLNFPPFLQKPIVRCTE